MRLHTFVIAILGCLIAPVFCTADETKEPPLQLTLFVNGKPIPVALGRERKLTGEFKNPTIVVRAAATRRFSYGGISFEYPAKFTWEAEIGRKAYRCWTLSGNDSKIMYFVVGSELTPEIYAKGIVEQFGAKNTTIQPIRRRFGKRKLEGKRVAMIIGGSAIVQDAFTIPAAANQWRLLVLQDVAPERTPELEEPKRVLDLLSKSFRVDLPQRNGL